MLKIETGLLRSNNSIIFILQYYNMNENLRNKGYIYYSEGNIFSLISDIEPELRLINEILYLPGSQKLRDYNPLFFSMKINRDISSHNNLYMNISLIFEKIINAIKLYNDTLTNKELKDNENIILEYLTPVIIIKKERLIIDRFMLEPYESNYLIYNFNTDIVDYYNLN